MTQNENRNKTFPEHAYILRRIPSAKSGCEYFKFDENLGKNRPTSLAFSNSSDGTPCSITLSHKLREQNRDDLETIKGYENFYLVKIPVKTIKDIGLNIEEAPLPDEPAHGYITGINKKSHKKKLAKAAKWVIAPNEKDY